MTIICLIGKSEAIRVETCIEKLGYNKIINYTTREQREGEINGKDYNFVTKEDFFRLMDRDMLMEWEQYGENYYGSPRPIGSHKNIIAIGIEGYEKIKAIYKKQTIGVYIKDKSDKPINHIEDRVDLVIDDTKDTETVAAEILKYVSER